MERVTKKIEQYRPFGASPMLAGGESTSYPSHNDPESNKSMEKWMAILWPEKSLKNDLSSQKEPGQ